MAAWQFDISMRRHGKAPTLTASDAMFAMKWLVGRVEPAVELMPQWSIFGEESGNRVDVAFEGEEGEVIVRIDARTNAERFIAVVCDLAAELRCSFYSDELSCPIVSTPVYVKEALQLSYAWESALDPSASVHGRS